MEDEENPYINDGQVSKGVAKQSVVEEEPKGTYLTAQIISDLHLEFKGAFDDVSGLIPKKSDILICAGDIGNVKFRYYELFFEWASKNFKYVLYVTGNHEYYFHEFYDVQKKMESCISKFENVHLLHRKKFEIGNTVFLGVTLWMNPPITKRSTIQDMYNDFKQISIKPPSDLVSRQLRLQDTMEMFDENIKYLRTELELIREENKNTNTKKSVVVISHHVPLRGLKFLRARERHPLFRDVMYGTCADSSDILLDYFEEIDAWIHGHSHNSLITSYTRQQILEETRQVHIQEFGVDSPVTPDPENMNKPKFDDNNNDKSEEENENEEVEGEDENNEKEDTKEEKRIWLISNQIGYPHQRDIKYRHNFQLTIPPPPAPKRSEIPEPEVYRSPPQEEVNDTTKNKPEQRDDSDSEDIERTSGNKVTRFFSGMKNLFFGDGFQGSGFSDYGEEDPTVYSVKRE